MSQASPDVVPAPAAASAAGGGVSNGKGRSRFRSFTRIRRSSGRIYPPLLPKIAYISIISCPPTASSRQVHYFNLTKGKSAKQTVNGSARKTLKWRPCMLIYPLSFASRGEGRSKTNFEFPRLARFANHTLRLKAEEKEKPSS